MNEIAETVGKFVIFFSVTYSLLWVAGYGWESGRRYARRRR